MRDLSTEECEEISGAGFWSEVWEAIIDMLHIGDDGRGNPTIEIGGSIHF